MTMSDNEQKPEQLSDNVLELRRANFVPGRMRCAKCKFVLTRATISATSGQIGAGTSEPEGCPNGCGPLWPVTWEQEARSAWVTAEDMFDRAFRAEQIVKRIAAMLEPAKHWSVIVASGGGGTIGAVTVFEAFGIDPQQCAAEVFAAHPHLAEFDLVAVVEAGGKLFVRDDNRTAEFGLQGG